MGLMVEASGAPAVSTVARMLGVMWVFPLVAAGVAFAFSGLLVRQYWARRRSYQLLWALSMLMYGVASLAVVVGVLSGWTSWWYGVYWALGAVLNVPFLAGGEIELLARNRTVNVVVSLVLVFLAAYTIAVLRNATFGTAALSQRLPSGEDVFGGASAAHGLPQLISIPSFTLLLLGTLWSAWKMRGRPDLRDRFYGTLLIALGASVVAGGATFAAFGNLPGFCITLVVGIAVMFAGFLRASRTAPVAAKV
jgi:hypothetical protein